MNKVDVAIVGGGLSGLYLAYLLEQKGISYYLLEAKPQLGGRILSSPVSAVGELSADLGPTWFWSHQRRVMALLERLGVPWFEQYTTGDIIYQLGQGQPPQRMAGSDTMLSYRVHGGMGSLIQALEDRVNSNNIRCDSPVRRLEKLDSEWILYSGSENEMRSIQAKKIVFAAPPRVLVNSLSLDQWLPESLCERLQSISTWMAAQAKFVATYSRPFWRERGLSGDAFSRVGPMVEIHDASAGEDEGYALFGFVGVPAVSRQQFPDDTLKQLCLTQLVDIFGEEALQADQVYCKDWAQDSYVATHLDLSDPPMHPHISLAPYTDELNNLNLYFAGTECAEQEGGYVEGALEAADAALQCLLS